MSRLLIAGLTTACLFCGSGAALAQDALPELGTPQPAVARHPRATRKRAVVAPATTPSAQNTLSSLVHGSPAQRELEQNDNYLANSKPIDHGKDAFFSDWKGLK